jgi:hypothetical protein
MAHWRGERPNTLGMLVVLDGGRVVRSWGVVARTHIVECARIAVSRESIQGKHRRLIRVTRNGVGEVVKEWNEETKQS